MRHIKHNLLEARSLESNCKIREAIELLHGEYGMIVTVINSDNTLYGIVSNGDLTKALLNGHSFDDTLDVVANKNPIKIGIENLNQNNFLTLIHQLEKLVGSDTNGKLFRLPVIDKSDKVVGLVTMDMLQSINTENKPNYDSYKPHVLVVGGAGYIGSILTEMIISKGWRVRVLDNLIYNQNSLSSFRKFDRFSFINGDVCNLHTQVESIKDIDCVVFLAEIVGDTSCEYLPQTALKTNYLAVNSMATLCAHTNVNRFVYTSSCSVYGASSNPDELLDEKSVLSPVSHYARMKISSEQALFNQLNPSFSPTILRLATVFGHSHRPRFDLVVNAFAKNAYFDKTLTVFGGEQWRPNIHVKDVARAIINVVETPLNNVGKEVFNVGSNDGNYTIKEMSELAKSVFEDCKVKIDNANPDKRNYRVDFSKLSNKLSYNAKYSILEGLKELKNIFESGCITDPKNKKYSNIESLIERD